MKPARTSGARSAIIAHRGQRTRHDDTGRGSQVGGPLARTGAPPRARLRRGSPGAVGAPRGGREPERRRGAARHHPGGARQEAGPRVRQPGAARQGRTPGVARGRCAGGRAVRCGSLPAAEDADPVGGIGGALGRGGESCRGRSHPADARINPPDAPTPRGRVTRRRASESDPEVKGNRRRTAPGIGRHVGPRHTYIYRAGRYKGDYAPRWPLPPPRGRRGAAGGPQASPLTSRGHPVPRDLPRGRRGR